MKLFIFPIFGCLWLWAATSPVTFAQEPADQALKLGTDLVVLDAQILNKKTGGVIGNISKEEVFIYEDGVRQEISHFSRDKLPLSILLVIDTSGSVWDLLDDMRQRTLTVLDHLKATDEMAVMATASKTALIQDFTTDRNQIADKLTSIDRRALGNNGILLHEALYQAALHLRRAANPSSRRIIIVVSDNISTQKIGRGHSEKEALNELAEAGSVVCGLTVSNLNATVLKFDPFYYAVKGLLFRGDINDYAAKTGGLVLQSKKDELDKKLGDLIDQLRTRYAIGYVSSNTKSDGSYRKIRLVVAKEVEKREGKLAIITRKGYFARKTPNADKTAMPKPGSETKPDKLRDN